MVCVCVRTALVSFAKRTQIQGGRDALTSAATQDGVGNAYSHMQVFSGLCFMQVYINVTSYDHYYY